METDSRRVSLEEVPNRSLLKGKECLTDFHEKLSSRGMRHAVIQQRVTGAKSQAQKRKWSVIVGQSFHVASE